MLTDDFDFELPLDRIAQVPAAERALSRLLVFHRPGGDIEHRTFMDFPDYLRAGDVLVLNNSKVIPSRMRAVNPRTTGHLEILLLEENERNDWWAMMRPGKRARLGTELQCLDRKGAVSDITAMVVEVNSEGHRRLQFHGTPDVAAALERLGELPLPPYIKRERGSAMRVDDDERYQTVFAQERGSIAAPTAGLHFTDVVLERLRRAEIQLGFVTLHVGLGTFAPVKAHDVRDHSMHAERYTVPPETAELVNAAKRDVRRVLAVGTTSLRTLESSALHSGIPNRIAAATRQETRLFVHPPGRFQITDGLLTNFHLPRSTLLMLVCAFATPGELRGRDLMLQAYEMAIAERYRFFSYGDAMLIL